MFSLRVLFHVGQKYVLPSPRIVKDVEDRSTIHVKILGYCEGRCRFHINGREPLPIPSLDIGFAFREQGRTVFSKPAMSISSVTVLGA